MLQIPQNYIHTRSTPFWNKQTAPAGIFERHLDKGTRPGVYPRLSVMHGAVKYLGYADEHSAEPDQVILIEAGQFARNAIAVIGDGHGIRCFAHDSFPVMNDFPLLRTFHQDFRSHEEVNVEISIVSHGFNVVPLFWREHRKLPHFDKDHLIRLCTVLEDS